MTTLSVPVPADLEAFIARMVENGDAANKADVVRKALYKLREDQAVQAVLAAQGEPTLKGDLRELAEKLD